MINNSFKKKAIKKLSNMNNMKQNNEVMVIKIGIIPITPLSFVIIPFIFI